MCLLAFNFVVVVVVVVSQFLCMCVCVCVFGGSAMCCSIKLSDYLPSLETISINIHVLD